jgi:uncharacterized protein (TIGR01777 family)
MRVLIIGGTGLIGKALASSLIARSHQVWILSRHPESVTMQNVTVVKWDGQTSAGWEKEAGEVDAIVNLAGESIGDSRWTRERKEQLLSSRMQAGEALVAAVYKARAASGGSPKVVVQSSAIGYYGPSIDREIVESDPAGGDFLAKVCIDWENSTRPVEVTGIRRVIIRTGLVLSLAGGVLPKMLLPFRLFVGGPVGSGKQWYSWIHIQDEVEAIRFLLENESAHGAYNLTSPQPLTNADFGRVIARSLRRPYWMPAPAFALKLALGEMSTLVLDGQKVIPDRLRAAGYQFHFQNADDALKDLASR